MTPLQRLTGAAVTAIVAVAGIVIATPTTASASCFTTTYKVTASDGAWDWEADTYNSEKESWWAKDRLLRGTGPSRSNGWTPVEEYYSPTYGRWFSLLEGPNDVHDFVRTSGLGCLPRP